MKSYLLKEVIDKCKKFIKIMTKEKLVAALLLDTNMFND